MRAELPGVPLSFGFNFKPVEDCPELQLSPEARQRVLDKIESVQAARRAAMVSSQFYVVAASLSEGPSQAEKGATE